MKACRADATPLRYFWQPQPVTGDQGYEPEAGPKNSLASYWFCDCRATNATQ